MVANSLRLARLSIFALSLGAVAGCLAEPEDARASSDRITDVPATPVKEQAIGNCWVYATNAWIESLHRKATGNTLDLSEAYVTYWRWFDYLSKFSPARSMEGTPLVPEGGALEKADDLIERYGLVREADFAADSAFAAFGVSRTKDALEAMNRALESTASPLRRAMAAGDRAALRRALDDVWKLPPRTRAELDRIFGLDASRTFPSSSNAARGSIVLDPRSLLVATAQGPGNVTSAPLSQVLGTWSREIAPNSALSNRVERRAFERRIQRALHDGLAVPIVWEVDPNALTTSGTYSAAELRENGRSRDTGGHASIVVDYEARGVPGFGTLAAGTVETRPAALAAALDDAATVAFFRIKNSWGTLPISPLELVGRIGGADFGEYDLETDYLYLVKNTQVYLPPGY